MLTVANTPFVNIGSDPLPKDLKGACKEMESYFFNMMLRTMRQAMVPNSSKGADSFAKETANSMLDGEWAKLATEDEGLGLWKSMYEQLAPAASGEKPGVEPVKSGEEKAEEKVVPHEFFALR